MIRLGFSAAALAGLCVSVFLLHACLASPPPHTDPSPLQIGGEVELRVLISWPAGGLSVSWEGEAKISPQAGEPANLAGGNRTVTVSGKGIRLGDRVWESGWLIIEPAGRRFTLESEDRAGKKRSAAYRGHLQVMAERGSLLPVNRVRLEEYLMGVVGREMSVKTELTEALRAQVIAARTYALYERSLPREGGFQLFDDERSQMYGGIAAESDLAREQVDATRGMIVLYQGQVVPTFYSSTCGGSTEPAWEVLERVARTPPLRGTACGFCTGSPVFEWTARVLRTELAQMLFGKPGRVLRVEVARAAPGGHALELEVWREGHPTSDRVVANRGFRHKVGARTIRSTLITSVESEGEALVFHGRGWGHAAGMCQWGAYGMAQAGRSAVEILEHYFPDARVKKIY